METQKTLNSQSLLEKEKQSWSGTKLQSSRQYGISTKQKYKPMEQNRESRDKLMHLFLTKEASIYIGERKPLQ